MRCGDILLKEMTLLLLGVLFVLAIRDEKLDQFLKNHSNISRVAIDNIN